MLREIKSMKDAELIIYNEAIWTPEEFAEELGLRFLIDKPEEEAEPEEAPEEDPEPIRRGGRKSYKEEILALWNGGEKTAVEIAEELGISTSTVYKYI